VAKSIYPPAADSNGNSGILPPPFGRNPASLPVFGLGSFASQNSENQNAQRFGSHSGAFSRRIRTCFLVMLNC
jgi:hypothetical protein